MENKNKLEIKETSLNGKKCEIAYAQGLNYLADNIVRSSRPFNEQYMDLKKSGFDTISAKEAAQLFMHNRELLPSYGECYLKEGLILVKDQGIYLTKNSPILEYPLGATNSHKRGKRYNLSENQLRKSLENSVNIMSKKHPIQANIRASYYPGTKAFNENEGVRFLFGDFTEEFGDFLKSQNKGINFLADYNLYKKPSANQLKFNPRFTEILGDHARRRKDGGRLDDSVCELIGIRY